MMALTATKHKGPGADPSRRRNLLIAVALLLALILVSRALVSWYLNASESLDQEAELRALQYEKLTRMGASAPELKATKAAIDSVADSLAKEHLIVGGTPSLSEAMFQNIVTEMAQKSRIDVRAVKALGTKKTDDMTIMQLSINARGEIGAIKDFLLQVRNSQRFIYFTELEIKEISFREKRYYYCNARLAALTS